MKIRGLLFDFDGLLVDTESPSRLVWEELYREHGFDLPREVEDVPEAFGRDETEPRTAPFDDRVRGDRRPVREARESGACPHRTRGGKR